ncbi:nuclear transport factor 2 family protein [Xanthobacter sp. YC-JY1]|uniref:nuclear transport factor 2 family protein n=1 Tax=Xanthobacter sp. YC-JY1 TaxID=2419844 RepID=UPI001F1AA605|nr:nuclear transport factor 2 family protein [Xanthobacter sp. YC-JY1]UJX46076.1 nuclear transport factor 2 family protein [Xanthobacter sp. YC-JY1]
MTHAEGTDVTLTREQMLHHAEAWIAAWNRRDVEAVLSAFADNARFRSPFALQVTGHAALEGRPAIEAYWRQALGRIERLEFRLLAAICDEPGQRMVVHYEATLGDTTRRACEIFVFRGGLKIEAEALYGDTAALPACG